MFCLHKLGYLTYNNRWFLQSRYGSRRFKIYGGYTLKYNKHTPREERVIVDKPHFSVEYDNFYVDETYICRCNTPLFSTRSKFDSGLPSFDENFSTTIKHIPDLDGLRTEIECANCGAHLGHGKFDTRKWVNSLAMRFIKTEELPETIHE